jgi:hypothetical protein
MSPNRIMLIRHAEKPCQGKPDKGVTAEGAFDDESLTIRGWQRAGALSRYFCPLQSVQREDARPAVVFAAGVGPHCKSKRAMQTAEPLVALLNDTAVTPFITVHLKDEVEPLVSDVLSRQGPVLIVWEHSLIPDLVHLLPNAPPTPAHWPGDCFDVVWILDRTTAGWSFTQRPQRLLPGDRSIPIPDKTATPGA